jgi:hypothetical protein
MIRELVQVVLAIHMSLAPVQHLPEMKVQQYAVDIQKGAEYAGVDPLILVAIATHESQWNERAISPDHKDYGLMQVRGMYYNGGQHNEWLLNPHYNFATGSYIIKKSIEFCRKSLKREPTLQEWMSVYQGSVPSCKPTMLTKIVEDYYLCLVRTIEIDVEQGPFSDCREVYWPVHRSI